MSTENTRSLQVTWEDPMTGARAARGMAGIEYLRAIRDGRFAAAPIARLMGFALVEVEEGRLVHGGLLATLLDSAMGCAVHSTLPAGTGYSTLEIKVNFTRPALMNTGPLRCEATLVHRGKQTATAEGRVLDKEGRVYAHGTTTCLLMSGA